MAEKSTHYLCTVNTIHEEVVTDVMRQLPAEGVFEAAAGFFKVMGDGTRFKILWSLDRAEMCVCDLAAALRMTKSAVSHQLRRLREADLVKAERRGQMVFYTIADDHVRVVLRGCMDHACEPRDGGENGEE